MLLMCAFDDMMLMLVVMYLISFCILRKEEINWTTCDGPHRRLPSNKVVCEICGLPVTTQGCWVAVLINHEGFILVPT